MADYTHYTRDQDELRRAHALDEAIRLAGVGTPDDLVLNAARKFDGYLKGGPTQIVLDVKPKPEPQPLLLPKPSHDLRDVNGGSCLACEWSGLQRKIIDAKGGEKKGG